MAYQSAITYTGQVTGITTTAQRLVEEPQASIREVLIQSDPANTTNLLIGNVSGQFVVLTPGQSFTLPVNSLTKIYIKMASGTGTVNWLARE